MAEERKKPTIEELEAILNDPTPQRIQLLPDGSICAVPDETAELVKQARAEVLAACAKRARQWYTLHPQDMHGESDNCYPCIDGDRLAKAILNTKPAASDLEALLREARLDEAKWWHNDGYPYHDLAKCLCLACSRVAELEKARAILEKR